MSSTEESQDTKIVLTKHVVDRKIMCWMSLFGAHEYNAAVSIKKYEWFLGSLDEEGEEGVNGFRHRLYNALANGGRFDHEHGEWILEFVDTENGGFIRHRWGNFTARMPEDFLEALTNAEIIAGNKAIDSDIWVD